MKRLAFDCDLCGHSSTDSNEFRGIFFNDSSDVRQIQDAVPSGHHCCTRCIKIFAEWWIKREQEKR